MNSHVSVNAPDTTTSSVGGGGALKEKIRSFSTLTTLYHESRQEMELLHKQVYMKDNIITDLKARLARYERIYLTAAGDPEAAAVSVGPSKSLLESLCQEICSLKAERSEHELGAARHREEIQRLTVQLREKDLELESVRCQPDHQKDLEIQRLHSALEEKERSEATRAVLYSSLAEEANQLRTQLGATVKVCQELLTRLETEKTKGDGEAVEMVQWLKDTKSTDLPDKSLLNAKLLQLQEENKQLKQRVTYGLNSQWQKYDSSREDYIRGLCQRLKESSGQGQMMPGLGSVSTGLLHQEITRLNGLLEEKMNEGSRLGREVEEMRRKDQERIQTLEQQVLIYADDFKSERRDRERAQGQIQDLKEQMYLLKQQLHKQQGATKDSRDLVPMCRVHIGHRISTRRHKDNMEHLLRTNAETQQQPAVVAAATVTAAAAPSPAWSECLSELQCPRCQAKFSDAHTTEYLKHWEECAKL